MNEYLTPDDIDDKRRNILRGAGTAAEPKGAAARMTSSHDRAKDGVDIVYKDWAAARRSCSRTAGR